MVRDSRSFEHPAHAVARDSAGGVGSAEDDNRLDRGALDLCALEFPGCEASRMKLIAVQAERRIESSKLDLHIDLAALHRLATNWARQSAPAMSPNNPISRAQRQLTATDCLAGSFSEANLVWHLVPSSSESHRPDASGPDAAGANP